jgi:Subunit 11 of the general transcription factor TFIIH
MDEQAPEPGGFLPPSLPSPAPSSASTSSTRSNLPHPRSHPLRAGSAKEDAARRYVEGRLLHISRRYTKKFQPVEESGVEDVKGYESMGQVAKDFGEIVNVVWLSGTRMFIPNDFVVLMLINNFLGTSKFTDPVSVEYCGVSKYISPRISAVSQINFPTPKKAGSCLFQLIERGR